MREYASRAGIRLQDLRFLFLGTRISSTDTAADLGMVDEDVIDVKPEQCGC